MQWIKSMGTPGVHETENHCRVFHAKYPMQSNHIQFHPQIEAGLNQLD